MRNLKSSIIWKIILREKKISGLIFAVSVTCTLLNSLGLTLLVPILFKVFSLGASESGPSKIEVLIEKYLFFIPKESPLSLLFFVIVLFLIKNGLSALRVYFAATVANRHLIYFRTELLNHFLKKELHYFYREGSGNLLNQLIMNVEKSSKAITDSIEVMGMMVQLMAYGGVLFFISWKLFLVCLICFAPLVTLLKLIGGRNKKLSNERAKNFGVLSQALADTIRGIRFVKLANREQDHIRWVQEQSIRLQEKMRRITFLSGIGQPITELAAITILMGFIAALIFFKSQTEVTVDSFFTFLLILGRALPLFNIVVGRIMDIIANLGTLSEVERALGDKSYLPTESHRIPMKKLRTSIVFDKVYFTYPDSERSVLNEISLEIKQGESVAIVGPSGSGKSTLTDLLLRFYDPTQGKILVDGQDISKIDRASYRKHVGLVPQESIMFFSTVRENVCYLNPTAPEIEVWRVLDQADLADFVSSLPNGLDTNIGEGGVNLSGGQKQRLSIARTLLLNPDILVFDEATSSLDSVSEAKIVDAIKAVSRGRTTITIAHRLATILHCDRIFLFEHGWLIESGKASELIQKSSRFRKYAESQNLKLAA